MNEVDDTSREEELLSSQHSFVDFELERVRHVFNYAIENLNAAIVDEKLDHIFYNLKWGAKVNLAFGFNLKNKEDGGLRSFYAHKNIAQLDRSKLLCIKDDLAKLKDIFMKTDVIECCNGERMNTGWWFYNIRVSTVFAAWLKDVPRACKDAVLITQKSHSQLAHVWRVYETAL